MLNLDTLLKIAHITDLHLGKPGEHYLGLDLRERFLRVLAHSRLRTPDFYILGGDYSLHDPDPQACRWLREQMDTLGAPYYILAGNHDDRGQLNEIFRDRPDEGPLYYHFEAGGYNHLVLDSCPGSVDEQQLIWLKEQLAESQQPVIWMHHPPDILGMPFMDGKHALKNRNQLLQILHGYQQPLSVFCGHYHASLHQQSKKLSIHVAPPTSFYIDTSANQFRQDDYPPGYQLVLLGQGRKLVVPQYA